MKLNVEIDMEDFVDTFGFDSVEDMIAEELKSEIMKVVKRDPRYKLFVKQKAEEAVNNLEVK